MRDFRCVPRADGTYDIEKLLSKSTRIWARPRKRKKYKNRTGRNKGSRKVNMC